jgi:hypothetical protein
MSVETDAQRHGSPLGKGPPPGRQAIACDSRPTLSCTTMLTDKLTGYASAATIAVMFFCLVWLQPLLAQLATTTAFAGLAAGALAALGVYRAISAGLLWCFRRNRTLRKFILGKYFLEGTWVGHYVEGDEHRFTKEFIDQSTGETVIHGREFFGNGSTRASWTSDSVNIDIRKMQLVYAYTCRVIDRKHVQEGLGVFNMIVQKADEPASILDGYAVDLIDGDRDPNCEHKISDEETSDSDAFAQARSIFKLHEAKLLADVLPSSPAGRVAGAA